MSMFVVHGSVNGLGAQKLSVDAINPDEARKAFYAAYPGLKAFVDKVKLDKSNGVATPVVNAVPISDAADTLAARGWRVKRG